MEVLYQQAERIKQKLELARKQDSRYQVFGAEKHKYVIHKPVSEADILRFEATHSVSLPDSYKIFLMQIGNGGVSYAKSAAGPFYGIFPLGEHTHELVDEPKKYFSMPVNIYPGMTEEYWQGLVEGAVSRYDLSEDEYDEEMGRIYAGILPIGSQGRAFVHGLLLNGEHKGRVVNLDLDLQIPQFAFESNFLDWYERWLDEVISGDLMKSDAGSFGYTMGGTEGHLVEDFLAAADEEVRLDCLGGLLNKKELTDTTIALIDKEYKVAKGENRKLLLQILTKNNYTIAKPYLLEWVSIDLLAVFQFIYWYQKEKSPEWLEVIEKHIQAISEVETFRFCTYLLSETGIDFGRLLLPCITNENESIRVTAFYTLGKSSQKEGYLDAFITGLHDHSNKVVHATLQALAGVKSEQLLIHYKKILDRFPMERDAILSNLDRRLHEMGLSEAGLREATIDPVSGTLQGVRKKKWYQIWK